MREVVHDDRHLDTVLLRRIERVRRIVQRNRRDAQVRLLLRERAACARQCAERCAQRRQTLASAVPALRGVASNARNPAARGRA